jgi:hypothetical protein
MRVNLRSVVLGLSSSSDSVTGGFRRSMGFLRAEVEVCACCWKSDNGHFAVTAAKSSVTTRSTSDTPHTTCHLRGRDSHAISNVVD